MALRRVFQQTLRLRPQTIIVSQFHQEAKVESPKENSSEYTSDGEKIHCGLKFTQEGSRTEEELAFILESARAKAFAESTTRCVDIKSSD